jgi:hypothetical protein
VRTLPFSEKENKKTNKIKTKKNQKKKAYDMKEINIST